MIKLSVPINFFLDYTLNEQVSETCELEILPSITGQFQDYDTTDEPFDNMPYRLVINNIPTADIDKKFLFAKSGIVANIEEIEISFPEPSSGMAYIKNHFVNVVRFIGTILKNSNASDGVSIYFTNTCVGKTYSNLLFELLQYLKEVNCKVNKLMIPNLISVRGPLYYKSLLRKMNVKEIILTDVYCCDEILTQLACIKEGAVSDIQQNEVETLIDNYSDFLNICMTEFDVRLFFLPQPDVLKGYSVKKTFAVPLNNMLFSRYATAGNEPIVDSLKLFNNLGARKYNKILELRMDFDMYMSYLYNYPELLNSCNDIGIYQVPENMELLLKDRFHKVLKNRFMSEHRMSEKSKPIHIEKYMDFLRSKKYTNIILLPLIDIDGPNGQNICELYYDYKETGYMQKCQLVGSSSNKIVNTIRHSYTVFKGNKQGYGEVVYTPFDMD